MANMQKVLWLGRTPKDSVIMVITIMGKEYACSQDGSAWKVLVDLDDPQVQHAVAATVAEAKKTGQMLVCDEAPDTEQDMMLLIAKTKDKEQLISRINQCTESDWIEKFRAAAATLNMSELVAVCESKLKALSNIKAPAPAAAKKAPAKNAKAKKEAPKEAAPEEVTDDLDI